MFIRPTVVFLFLFLFITLGSRATRGVLLVTADPNPEDKWRYTLVDRPLEFSKADSVYPDQPFSILLFLAQYAAGFDQRAYLTYNLEVTAPDGNIVFRQEGLKALDAQVKDLSKVLMSETNLRASLSTDHPMGRYQIAVRLYDWADNTYQDLSTSVVLTPFRYRPYFDSPASLEAWQQQYYRKPFPGMALDGFLYLAGSEWGQDESTFWPMFCFFLEIFKQNPFLADHLVIKYPRLDEPVRRKALHLLRFMGYQNPNFYRNLPEKDFVLYEQLRKGEMDLPESVARTPRDLDILWYQFLATGRFATARTLLASASLTPLEGTAYRSQGDRTAGKDLPDALLEGTAQLAWVKLRTVTPEHKLLRGYWRFLHRYTETSEDQQKRLDILIEE
jgi:hypothetical protein